MRTLLAAMLMILGASCAQAQDPGQMAAEQAAQLSQQAALQASQQAMQDMQKASMQASQDAANASQIRNAPTCCYIAKPTFSLKAGTYSGTTTVKIRDTTRGAVIYYTTDGWTPTVASKRYTGPISIDSTMTLQAVAIGPVPLRSLVASATYTINGALGITTVAQNSSETSIVPAFDAMGKPVLPQGMAVPLVFVSAVNSKTADVGDKIVLAVAEDIKAGDVVLIKKGTPAFATVTEAYKSGAGGVPGNVAFQVNSMAVNGSTVVLRGTKTKEGEPKPPNAAVLVPVVGLFTLFRHGKDVDIKPGTPLTTYVDTDTLLASAKDVTPPVN
jgi:hypothetical protein